MKHPRSAKRLTWQDITVQQFLDIYRLSISPELEDIDRVQRAVCICFDKTEKQVDEMTMQEFNQLASQVAFILTEPVPGKAKRVIRVGQQRFKITYAPHKLRHRQYVEILYFGEKPVDNMHFILASIVEPVNWYGKRLRNEARDHEKLADALLQARVVDVYHSAVFFCNLYINSITSIRDYLEQSLIREKKAENQTQAAEQVTALINAMVGYIPPKNLRILKEYR